MGNKHSKKTTVSSLKELKETLENKFTSEEIEDWYKWYMDSLDEEKSEEGKSKKGKLKGLTRKSFIKVYNSLFDGDASAFADEVFRVFDTNHDDVVDFNEFLMGMYVSGSPEEDTVKLEWAFKMYDRNGDGRISKEEMSDMFRAICRMTFAKLPESHSTPEKLTELFFEKFDENKDGMITESEFIKNAKDMKDIVNMLQISPCG